MPPHLSSEANELLTAQANVIAVWQVAVPNRRAMAHAFRRGHWQRVTHNVYAAGPAEPTNEQLLWAAALHFGPTSMLSGQAALEVAGWTGKRKDIDVLVPAATHVTDVHKGFTLHRTAVMPRSARRGIPRAIPAAATVDAAAWAGTDREAEFVTVSSLQQKLCQDKDVERILRDRPTAPRRGLILATIAEFRDGVTTMGELDFKRLCQEYAIRQPDRQVWRTAPDGKRRRLDCYWDAEGVVLEIDGVGHLDLEQMLDDQARQNGFVARDGLRFLRITNFELRYEPELFMALLQTALGQRAA